MSLTQKILAAAASLVVALTLTTLAFTTQQADQLARESITRGLTETPRFWTRFQAERTRRLRLGLDALAHDPDFGAAVAGRDGSAVSAILGSRGGDLDAKTLIVTDEAGGALGRRDGAGIDSSALWGQALAGQALAGAEAAGLLTLGSSLHQAVAVPVPGAGGPVGVLVGARALDADAAAELRMLSRADFAFLVPHPHEGFAVAASSLGPREGALATLLALGRLFPREPVGTARGLFDVELAGDEYLAMSLPLDSIAAGTPATVLALCNHTDEMASFRRFRRSLLLASLSFTVVALGLAAAGARRLTGPLRLLAERVERARDGSYQGAVAVRSRDEVGVLARAFNRLLADLREKDQLVRFLRERGTRAGHVATGGHPAQGTQRASAPATDSFDVGVVLGGRYEIQERIGQGGMGVVYRALDRRLGEPVALKVLRAAALARDPGLAERVTQEIRLARRITHPNVLRTHDLIEIDGLPVISMEYVDGVSLKALVAERGALPLGVGLRVAKQICQGLDAAHRSGVVHRDVKPQNMIVARESGVVKIMDFGIARLADAPLAAATQTVTVLGTPDYMAPEQVLGQSAERASDIYSLGVVLFEMFTQRLPFVAESITAVLMKHVHEAPPAPRSLNPALPEALEAVILSCLQKDPAHRPHGADEVLEDLTRVSTAADGLATLVA